MTHLQRDWDAERARFDSLHSHVLTGDDLEAELQRDPNSAHNVRRRQQQKDPGG